MWAGWVNDCQSVLASFSCLHVVTGPITGLSSWASAAHSAALTPSGQMAELHFNSSLQLKLNCFICSHILIVLLCSSYRLKLKQDPVLHLPPGQTPQAMRVLAPRRLVPLSVVASSSCEEWSRPPALQTSVTLISYILPEIITFFCIILLILMFLSRLCKLWRPNPECQCACVRYSRAERACWPAVWLLWIIQLDVNKYSIDTAGWSFNWL